MRVIRIPHRVLRIISALVLLNSLTPITAESTSTIMVNISEDEHLKFFINEYCANENTTLADIIDRLLECREAVAVSLSESNFILWQCKVTVFLQLPGMSLAFQDCWADTMQTPYPAVRSEWASAMCDDEDFLLKKDTMTICSLSRFTSQETTQYINNMDACMKRQPHGSS